MDEFCSFLSWNMNLRSDEKMLWKGKNWKLEIERIALSLTEMVNLFRGWMSCNCIHKWCRKSLVRSFERVSQILRHQGISFVNTSVVLIRLIRRDSCPLSLREIFPLTFYCPSWWNLHPMEKRFCLSSCSMCWGRMR